MNKDFYLNFEETFRGNRENIIDRLSMYDSLVQLIIKQHKENKFLDIGSGRGEWLERWNKEVQDCIGIELDSVLGDYCLNNGFNIIKGDAIKTLEKFENGSVSLITIFLKLILK